VNQNRKFVDFETIRHQGKSYFAILDSQDDLTILDADFSLNHLIKAPWKDKTHVSSKYEP